MNIVGLRSSCAAIALSVACLSFVSGAPAVASEAEKKVAAADSVGEIVVTARRQAENIQSVPISVSALSGDFLEKTAITTAQDLQGIVPSLNVNSGNSRDINRFAIRGQGVVVFSDSGVISYFAEVPLLSNGAGPGFYYDLANVQVLNGPQGTLFGRNTTGGAVLFEPNRPTNNLEGNVQVDFGNYNNRAIKGAVNVPIINDKLLFRAAGEYHTRDGYTKDVNTGRDYDNTNYYAARLSLTFKPTDDIENYLMFYGISSHNHGTGAVVTDIRPTSSAVALFPGYTAAYNAQQARDVRHVALGPINLGYKVHNVSLTDIFTWKITDDVTFKNIASYQTFKSLNQYDLDGSPFPILETLATGTWNNTSSPMNQRGFTEEPQFSGKLFGDKLSWLVGGFLSYDEPINLDEYGVAVMDNGRGAGESYVKNAQKLRSQAIYTQETLDLGKINDALDGLRLTGGIRYTHDFKSRTGGSRFPISRTCSVTTLTYPNCTVRVSSPFSATTYNVSVDYQVTSNVMIYATHRTGFKSGTFNVGQDPRIPVAVNPEHITDYEGGFKSDWKLGDAKLRLNASGFHQNYKGVQRNVFVNINGTLFSPLTNASSARIDGMDLHAELVPVEGLELTANYAYLNARYKRFTSATAGVIDGQALPFSPRNSYNLAATYHLPIDQAMGDLSATVRFSHQSSVRAADENTPGIIIGSFGLLNLSANWAGFLGYENLDLGLYMNNATNKTYKTLIASYYNTIGFVSAGYGEPRTYGATIRYSF